MGQVEPDGLAALLLTLKERSGLSYGMLARRLHMSTSTVHRYCSGETVPLDYAPVERFARLGKATPSELTELHRQWVLANERRLGRDTARPAQPASPASAASPASPASAASPVSPALPASATSPASASPPETSPGRETSPGSEANPGREASTGLEASPSPETKLQPEVALPPEATPAVPPPTRRVRRWTVGALITAAVMVAVTIPVAAWDLRDSDRDPKGAALQPVDAAGPSTSASTPGRSDSSAPAPSSQGPTTAADRPAGGSGPVASRTSQASPSAPSGATELDTGPPPLHVTVTSFSTCARNILVNAPPAGVTPPPEVANTSAWVSASHGIATGGQEISVTVQGTGDETVVLHALHVRTTAVSAPAKGSVYLLDDGCGGGVPTTYFNLDLDAPHPEPRAENNVLPRKVSQSDPEELHIDTQVEAHDVSWYLELEWSSGGRHGTMRIDDNGHPFRNTGVKGRPEYYFDYPAHQWTPV